uniref:hypothetical protein n=1 Tax=Streptococcus suis TaxID=1307 RepID=UPI000945D870
KALAATSIAGGFLVFLYEKNWLEAIMQKTLLHFTKKLSGIFEGVQKGEQIRLTRVYTTVKHLDTTGFLAR